MGIKEVIFTRILNFPWEHFIPKPSGAKGHRELISALKQLTPKPSTSDVQNAPADSEGSRVATQMPTTEETKQELKRRLAKELYRLELDLQGGGRIANKPCDCLSVKHHLGIEATAEELMSYEKNPVYSEVISWLNEHESEFEPEEIGRRPPEHYQGLAPEARRFRKEIMGTERLNAILAPNLVALEEAKRLAAQEAAKEIERQWPSHNPGATLEQQKAELTQRKVTPTSPAEIAPTPPTTHNPKAPYVTDRLQRIRAKEYIP